MNIFSRVLRGTAIDEISPPVLLTGFFSDELVGDRVDEIIRCEYRTEICSYALAGEPGYTADRGPFPRCRAFLCVAVLAGNFP